MGGGGGSSESKSGAIYQPAINYMPATMQQQAKDVMSGYFNMPTSIPIGYGGNVFQMASKAPMYGGQMAYQLFSPQLAAQASKSESSQAPQLCGMSCFMFEEAERNEKLKELRSFRDTYFPRGCMVQVGYSKMSRILVPAMKKSGLLKEIVKLIMTKPLIAFAKSHYRKNRYGIIFYPVAWMWRNIWWVIGKYAPIREYTWEEFFAVTKDTRYDILRSS